MNKKYPIVLTLCTSAIFMITYLIMNPDTFFADYVMYTAVVIGINYFYYWTILWVTEKWLTR